MDTPIQKINVHVRGGFIIPMQTPGPNLILGRGNPFQLLVALASSGNASGNLFWDDGDSVGMFSSTLILVFCVSSALDNLDPFGTKAYNYLEFTLTSTVSQNIKSLFMCFFIY